MSTADYPGHNFVCRFVPQLGMGEELTELTRPFSLDEIKATMFSLPQNKAPGPDGFNAFFFRSAWDIVGIDVIEVVKEFLKVAQCSMLKAMNTTIIAMIPKVPNPIFIKDFPISCCNTVYKVIFKLLANCLKQILPNNISECQSAFMESGAISDNIFLA